MWLRCPSAHTVGKETCAPSLAVVFDFMSRKTHPSVFRQAKILRGAYLRWMPYTNFRSPQVAEQKS